MAVSVPMGRLVDHCPLVPGMVSRALTSGLEAFLIRPWEANLGARWLGTNEAGRINQGPVTPHNYMEKEDQSLPALQPCCPFVLPVSPFHSFLFRFSSFLASTQSVRPVFLQSAPWLASVLFCVLASAKTALGDWPFGANFVYWLWQSCKQVPVLHRL